MSGLGIGGLSPEQHPLFRQSGLPAPAADGSVRVPGKIVYPSSAAAIADLWRLTENLALLHAEREALDRRLLQLRERLADPALFGHARRGDAEQRHEDLVNGRATIESRLQVAMLLAGDIYLALPEGAREGLGCLGWAPVVSRGAMRIWLEACLATGSLPVREAPF